MSAAESTIHLVDDDRGFLAAMQRALDGFRARLACCGSAEEFLGDCRPEQAGCLVADIRLPGMDGLELQEELARRGWHIPLVFVTGHGDVKMAVSALKRGAVDFLEKPFGSEALRDSVERALAVDRRARALAADRAIVLARLERLTPRELEVLSLVVANQSAKEIASRLCISPRTVEHHREHLMAKMEADTWHDLFTMAVIGRLHEPRL